MSSSIFSTLGILALGLVAFMIGTATGVLLAKLMNKLSKKHPINPLIGAAGVSAVPMAARVANKVGLDENPNNYLLMHAMGPNVAGVIGSAVAAGSLACLGPHFAGDDLPDQILAKMHSRGSFEPVIFLCRAYGYMLNRKSQYLSGYSRSFFLYSENFFICACSFFIAPVVMTGRSGHTITSKCGCTGPIVVSFCKKLFIGEWLH